MDFEKTAVSFEKRFAKKCERISYAGMPLNVLSERGRSLSAALSVGGCAAIARRDDGRFNVEFDDNNKVISCNVSDVGKHTEEPMLGFLARAEALSVKPGGADIVFEYNTEIYHDFYPILLSSMYFFCGEMPGILSFKDSFEGFEHNMAGLVGRKNTLLLQRGERLDYVPFPNDFFKIVLCCFDEKNTIAENSSGSVLKCAAALLNKDYGTFSKIMTDEAEICLKKGKIGARSKNLFEIAVKLGDAGGCGFLKKGGIFAIVENVKVNAFMQNLRSEYENYYGAAPDFYVTETEDSGIYAYI